MQHVGDEKKVCNFGVHINTAYFEFTKEGWMWVKWKWREESIRDLQMGDALSRQHVYKTAGRRRHCEWGGYRIVVWPDADVRYTNYKTNTRMDWINGGSDQIGDSWVTPI